jgi:hypothetical protein
MGLSVSTGGTRELGESRAVDVVLIDEFGNPIFGFNPDRPDNATLSNVSSSVTSVSLLAANPARRGFVIYNDSTKTLRVAFGVAASATTFSVLIPAKATYSGDLDGFTGELFGIWEALNGSARITELT